MTPDRATYERGTALRSKHALGAILATLVLALTMLGMHPATAAEPVRIMPLGDSITGSPGCWRALLWNQLVDAGYTDIDFVGTLPAQGCGVAYDGDNEGHGGALVTNVADQNQLPTWLSATNPDIVLMHFGTNDVWSNIAPDRILAAYTKLVSQMRANNPNMKILVAQIIPMSPSTCPECAQRVIDLNAVIPAWAESVSTVDSPVIVVDQWTGFDTATDTGDGVHPNDSGIVKMADRWYPPLADLLTPGDSADTTAPSVPSGLKVTGTTSSSVSLSWSAATDNVGVAGYDVFRDGVLVRSPSGTSYTDTGLSAATTYTYAVRARDAAGNVSALSDSVMAGTAVDDGSGNGCTAEYRVDNDWGSGFTAAVTVTNPTSSPINGWTVTWTWAGDEKVTGAWNATVSQPAQEVTATNAAYNGTVAPGASTSFGFQASYTGSTTAPTLSCTAS